MQKGTLWLLVLASTACGTYEAAEWQVAAGAQTAPLAQASPCTVSDVRVRNFGRIVFEGDVELLGEVTRILHGQRRPFRHDGSVFKNREHRLPDAGAGYYHEYVHPTTGLPGPGPQRLIRGGAGEFDYTPDHYASFVLLDPACAASIAAFTEGVD